MIGGRKETGAGQAFFLRNALVFFLEKIKSPPNICVKRAPARTIKTFHKVLLLKMFIRF